MTANAKRPYQLPDVTLSDAMRRECERKNVTDPDTIEKIARFETFLRHAGRPGEATDEQKAFIRAALGDDEWREFLLGEDAERADKEADRA